MSDPCVYVFDVDGTLTPSRARMDAVFEKLFVHIAQRNPVYLVTGSDRSKTLEQVGHAVYNAVAGVYQCSGAELWNGERCVRTQPIEVTDNLREFFDYCLGASQFKYKTGNHVDVRAGLINYSVIGHNADTAQRSEYVKWDNSIGERRTIAATFNNAFGDVYNATVAGETGIDITYLGAGKHVIVDELVAQHADAEIAFFGDKTEPGGNDHTITRELLFRGYSVFPVDSWQSTERQLRVHPLIRR